MTETNKKQTLFHVVKPLILLFNLAYGFNLGNRKSPTCRKTHPIDSLFRTRNYTVMILFHCSFYLFAFNEPEIERLIGQLKRFKIGTTSERVTSRMLKIFLVALAPVALPCGRIVLAMLLKISDSDSVKSATGTIDHLILFFNQSLVFLCISGPMLFAITVLIFPVLLSCLCCVLVSYCPSRLDDHVEDILRAHSPLRRGKFITRLCHAYYQLQPLASMTNRSMATTMSLMKVFTMLLWVMCCSAVRNGHYQLLLFLPILQYTIPLLMYLVVAPSANNMQLKLFEAAAEVLMVDDEWRGYDPISRSLLIKMRLNLLQHLVHVRMDQGPFTLFGDPVDPETLFMIFIEANDLRTTLR